jgi:hypothetical protein
MAVRPVLPFNVAPDRKRLLNIAVSLWSRLNSWLVVASTGSACMLVSDGSRHEGSEQSNCRRGAGKDKHGQGRGILPSEGESRSISYHRRLSRTATDRNIITNTMVDAQLR